MATGRAALRGDQTDRLVGELLARIATSTKRASEGKTTYLIGNNGTGKSRILARLAEEISGVKPARHVACISNSIYDRFRHGDYGLVRYLGARTVTNAVFHTSIDRQLGRLILQAMLIDRGLLHRLSGAVKMDFSFQLGKGLREQVEKLIDVSKPRGKGRARADLLTPRSLAMLERISTSGGRFDNLSIPQIKVFLRYLELNIPFDLHLHLRDGKKLNFDNLSTGEQNRTLLFAKVLSAMNEGTVFLIDEPEISLHLHWQMKFHETLMELVQGLRRFHVVVATHAPIVISEAAKFDPTSRLNRVAVLHRKLTRGVAPSDQGPGETAVTYDMHTFADVASHDYLVLRYFRTATYHAHEVSAEIADAVLRIVEGKEDEGKSILGEIRCVEGLSEEATAQIESALDLIKRRVLRALVDGA